MLTNIIAYAWFKKDKTLNVIIYEHISLLLKVSVHKLLYFSVAKTDSYIYTSTCIWFPPQKGIKIKDRLQFKNRISA